MAITFPQKEDTQSEMSIAFQIDVHCQLIDYNTMLAMAIQTRDDMIYK